MEQNQQYRLGAWTICPRTNTISNHVDSRSLDNKSMQLLVLLINHQGSTVTKDQIFKQVWKDKFVTDDILSVTVSKIRKALGDNARSPSFIKTVSGEGYALIATASKVEEPPESAPKTRRFSNVAIGALFFLAAFGALLNFYLTKEQPDTPQLAINSIAVLPFDDLSAEQDNQYLTDGLSDAIINQLSQTQSLKVISRYSSFNYRGEYEATDIGQALQVETLLDGSIQKLGDQVRINVRIFSTKDGQQLWSQIFDGNNEDIFEIQDRISQTIKARIQPGFQPPSKTGRKINAQAYEWYLLGQYHWRQRNPESLSKAVTYFTRSLEQEPDFVDAHVGLAITYEFLHTYGNWNEKRSIDAALPHIERALILDPDSASALAAKGLVLTEKAIYKSHSGQPEPELYLQAKEAFISSLTLDDNATTHQWYSSLLARMGEFSEVIRHLEKATELNPLSASLKRAYSFELLGMGKRDSAQRMYQEAVYLEPNYFSRPIESSRINRYTADSVIGMIAWHRQNPALFEDCASIEYCEHLIFAYLSIGAEDAANELLTVLGPLHFHFRTSLNAISASAQQDAQRALRHIERFANWLPNRRRPLFSVATAQFRANDFSNARESLLKLHPDWQNTTSAEQLSITPDNYSAVLLYAATLSELKIQSEANILLNKLKTFLASDPLFDKTAAEFALAEVNALSGNKQQSLFHLASALEMGWMETLSREWWTLANNHFLKILYDEPEFTSLVLEHHKKQDELRNALDLPGIKMADG